MSTTRDARVLCLREAIAADLEAIGEIYNQGITDRIATLDSDPKSDEAMREWWAAHTGRYAVIVAARDERIAGWASLNPYSHRCAYDGVADLSVYVARDARGTGIGTVLLNAIERSARRGGFHKIVLFAIAANQAGQELYRKLHYREVGVFREQGRLDGRYVDVVAMEKLLV